MSNIPLPLPDKPGQGELYQQVSQLTKDMAKAVERGDTHEAKCVERRLDTARLKFHHLHNKKVPPDG